MAVTAAVITTIATAVAAVATYRQCRNSGPIIKVWITATAIPGEARCQAPGQLAADLGIIIVEAHNYSVGPATIEEWGFETRTGMSFGPPLRRSDELDGWYDSSLRISGHERRRWAVEESWLEARCDRERVTREDVRPWIKVCGKPGKIRPRRWGLPDCYGENVRWRDTSWLAWHQWRKRMSRPVSVVLGPHLIPVYEATDGTGPDVS